MSQKKHFRVYVPKIIGGLLAGLAIFFFVKVIIDFISEKPTKHEKKIQPITLLKPPPPPPPPPKVETPPPPPEEKQKIEESEPEPEPIPDAPDEAPAQDLGLDAEGTAGSDGFGLAARKGGTGLFGGGGDPYAHYGGQVKKALLDLLSAHDELRRKSYTANIKIWFKSDGTVDRLEMTKGSNDPEIDDILNKVLENLKKVGDELPPGMPQPMKIRISDRI
jgi:protein TonB